MLATLALALVLDSSIAVVPRPAHLTAHRGAFTLTASTVIVADRATRELGAMLGDYLFPATGFRLAVGARAPAGARVISFGLDWSMKQLGDEGYRLEVGTARVSIRAYRPAGAFYAIQTLRQLLPPGIRRQGEGGGGGWTRR